MKLTAKQQEANLLQSLCPASERTFGNKSNPRYMEASMFDLLQWTDAPKSDHSADFKSKGGLLKDRINKAANPWQTESKDNFRKYVYSPFKGKLFFGYTKEELKEAGKKQEKLKIHDVNVSDENDFASEYQRSYAKEQYVTGYVKPKRVVEGEEGSRDKVKTPTKKSKTLLTKK